MKSSTLIASYLWRDTWSRWLEQPSSVLARLFVGGILVTVATVILVAYALLERNLESRLEQFGLNTILTTEMVSISDPEMIPNQSAPDRLAPWTRHGEKLRLRQLYQRAETPWQKGIMVFSYPPEALRIIAPMLSSDTPLICMNEALPEGALIEVTLNEMTGKAVVRRPTAFFRPLSSETLILAPQGWNPEAERTGFVETTLFKRTDPSTPMERFVDSLRLLYQAENRPVRIQSPLAMLHELETLQSRQAQWRSAMAGMLGLVLALVFGAIAVLEFRQNMYISALLRSFGTPRKALYIRQWLENAFLANLAALSAVLVLASFHSQLFGMLGFPKDLLRLDVANPYFSWETVLILFWVNVGAFLSSISVAIGLRKPVGEILS